MKSYFLQKEHQWTIAWFFATAIGFVVGEVFLRKVAFRFVPLSLIHHQFDWHIIMLGVAAGMATGLAVGVFQWLILRNFFPHSWLWILVTPLGMASGIFIGRFIFTVERQYIAEHITANILGSFWTASYWITRFVEGIMLGLSQLVVIKRSLPMPWIWMAANGVGWAVANFIEGNVLRPMLYPCCFFYFFSPISESLIYGIGGILLWLRRQNNSMMQNAA